MARLLWQASIIAAVAFLAMNPTLWAAEIEEEVTTLRFSVTDHLIFSNTTKEFSNDQTNLFMHEDFVAAEAGNYQASVHFTNRFTSDPKGTDKPFSLEKKTLAAEWEQWDLRLGDSHQEFGKGIALSLYRDDAFGVNHTLEGISLKFRPKGLELHALAGRVNTLASPVAIYALEDPLGENELWLMGGEAKISASSKTRVGAHYLLALNSPPEYLIRRFNKYTNTIGASFEQREIAGSIDFYAEGNILLQHRLKGEDYVQEPTGYGSYASLVWSPLPWIAKVEVKDYRDYHFPFRRPPTLEEDIVETTHSEDTFGTRLTVEHRNVVAKAGVQGSYLYGTDRFLHVPIHHGVLGGNYKNLELKGGYRILPTHSDLIHGALKIKIPTLRHQAVELNAQKLYARTNIAADPIVEDRNKFDLTYTFSRSWNASLGYEYVPSNPGTEHFVNVGAELKTGALLGKAFLGRTSGGTMCSGGVCRRVPPYTGAMVETQVTF